MDSSKNATFLSWKLSDFGCLEGTLANIGILHIKKIVPKNLTGRGATIRSSTRRQGANRTKGLGLWHYWG